MPAIVETADRELSSRRILAPAWPIILANIAVPLLGMADTAVIGHLGRAAPLAAVAIGARVFSFLYLGLWWVLQGPLGNHGLWLAFVGFFIARGITLGMHTPTLVRSVAAAMPATATADRV